MSKLSNYDHNPKRDVPIIFGFLLAPFVSSCLISGVIAFNSQLGLTPFFGSIPITFAFSTYATLILGLPTYFVMKKFYKITWLTTFLAGLVIGAVSGIVFSGSAKNVEVVSTLSAIGGLSALSFWVLWKQGQRN